MAGEFCDYKVRYGTGLDCLCKNIPRWKAVFYSGTSYYCTRHKNMFTQGASTVIRTEEHVADIGVRNMYLEEFRRDMAQFKIK